MNHLPGFSRDIKDELYNELLEVVKERDKKNKALALILSGYVVCFLVYIIGLTSLGFFIKGLIPYSLFVLPLFIHMGGFRINHLFKTRVISKVLDHLLPGIKYKPTDQLTASNLRGAKLFNFKPNTIKGEDLFEGKRGETTFRFSEIKTDVVALGRFKGILIKCKCDIAIDKSLRIYSKRAHSKNQEGNMIPLAIDELENAKYYDAIGYLGTNYDAILNDEVLSLLTDIKNVFDDGLLYVSFFPKSVHLAIKTAKDYFEPNLRGKITIEQVESIYSEIVNCLLVVDIIEEISQRTKRIKKLD